MHSVCMGKVSITVEQYIELLRGLDQKFWWDERIRLLTQSPQP